MENLTDECTWEAALLWEVLLVCSTPSSELYCANSDAPLTILGRNVSKNVESRGTCVYQLISWSRFGVSYY